LDRRFGRDECCDFESAERREWLVTNGIGGYASGTIAFALARRYHGLLIAALAPPAARTMLVPKFDETATYRGAAYHLSSNRWSDGTVAPAGHLNIESFALDGTAPVWRFALADAVVERRIWMPHGRNATLVRYRVERSSSPVDLQIDVFADCRDHHGSTRADGPQLLIEQAAEGFTVADASGMRRCAVRSPEMTWTIAPAWYYAFELARERERGLDEREDHLRAALGRVTLDEGASCIVELRALPDDTGVIDASWEAFAERTSDLRSRWRSAWGPAADASPAWLEQLALAADQFVVDRGGDVSVIAGYPWFADWGRDTMISLPGLALATGRPEIAKSALRTFARYVDQGMIPNRFPDATGPPEYNTADATLWYFVALSQYWSFTHDLDLAAELFPMLADVIEWHVRGTRYGIRRDPADGLLSAGEAGVQLTWMDAKVGDRVVTPRAGKPVEINALWLQALRTMSYIATNIGKSHERYDALWAAARSGFARFWNPTAGYCNDVLDGPEGDDATLRPNQIFAALAPSALTIEQRRAVVDVCGRELLVSYGLRSLAPSDPRYEGTYGGDPARRDGAYHQGTAWGYLLGVYALAHMSVYGDAKTALSILEPMGDALRSYGLGTLGEIFDGDAPFRPRGCIAQAWTVAETLRAWHLIATEEHW
jgi:predicted glycogen debranching enzyme